MHSENVSNNSIVELTSPALCTPIPLYRPIMHLHWGRKPILGDTPYGHRQYGQKFGKNRACGSGAYPRGETDPQTDILITILRNRSRWQSNKNLGSVVSEICDIQEIVDAVRRVRYASIS